MNVLEPAPVGTRWSGAGTSRDDRGVLTPCGHLEVSCLPCHRPSSNRSGSRCRRCCPPAPTAIPSAATGPRIADRVVFDKLIQVLVFGCGYRRIADHTCSATTLRRRRDEWITAGVAEQLRLVVLAAYDQLFGLELAHLAVDGCTTKAPAAARSPDPARGPPQAGAQALGGHRSGRHPAGGGAGPGQPPRLMGCWRRPWTPSVRWVRCPPSQWCTWTPATTTSRVGRS